MVYDQYRLGHQDNEEAYLLGVNDDGELIRRLSAGLVDDLCERLDHCDGCGG